METKGNVAAKRSFCALLFVVALVAALATCLAPTVAIADEGPSVGTQAIYRLYNPEDGNYFYTASTDERDSLIVQGWVDEGVAWYAPSESSTPVYRLYNSSQGFRYYTLNADEKDMLVAAGWQDEGIGWYSDDTMTVSVYRLYNPNATVCPFIYTTSTDERDRLVELGCYYEGIGLRALESGEAKLTALPAEYAMPPEGKSLVYTGEPQRGVTQNSGEGTYYTLSGDVSATEVGTYTVTATLLEGYAWADGSSKSKTITWTIAPATTQAMYRLYNPNSGEHFYTASAAERFNLIIAGWSDEGIGWTAPVSSNTPVFRMYNANPSPTTGSGEHHYTTSEAERDSLVAAGWEYEGIGWYSADSTGTPLYRVYNPNEFNNNHHYTTSKDERDNLVSLGWRDEGIAWYGV